MVASLQTHTHTHDQGNESTQNKRDNRVKLCHPHAAKSMSEAAMTTMPTTVHRVTYVLPGS